MKPIVNIKCIILKDNEIFVNRIESMFEIPSGNIEKLGDIKDAVRLFVKDKTNIIVKNIREISSKSAQSSSSQMVSINGIGVGSEADSSSEEKIFVAEYIGTYNEQSPVDGEFIPIEDVYNDLDNDTKAVLNKLGFVGKPVVESILDPVQISRDEAVFDKNDKMHKSVKEFIEKTAYDWYNSLDEKSFEILGFKMIGSLTSFQYTDVSDADVEILLKVKPGYKFSDVRKLFKILPNGNNIPGTTHPVNYYFQDVEDQAKDRNVEALYDITNEKWEKKIDKQSVNIPVAYAKEIARFFTDSFDLLLGRFDRDIEHLDYCKKLNPKRQEITESEKDEAVAKARTQLMATVDSGRMAIQLLRGFQDDPFRNKNFFKVSINYKADDPRFSMNNAIYKYLEKFEYTHRIREKIDTANKKLED